MSILQDLGHLKIPLEDVRDATNNFSATNVLGYGGYGLVYKGELLGPEGLITIAAKRVDRKLSHGENHFLSELKVLSSYKHVNIVSLIGFCDEQNEKILVQGFVTYGSLDHYLSSAKLTWLKRVQICLGAARGLSYLHNGLEGQSVIHRLVKSRSILLDETWQAKIGGLGLSMIGSMHANTFVSDGFVNTPGYADPTYLQTGVITKESGVYSFGVVLFEILCGRETFDRNLNNKPFLGPLARMHYEKGILNQIVDPLLMKQMSQESLKEYSAIAYQCLEKLGTARPTMIEIVQKLENVLRIQQDFERVLAFQQILVESEYAFLLTVFRSTRKNRVSISQNGIPTKLILILQASLTQKLLVSDNNNKNSQVEA
ncbi:receptor-like protein kinase HERK 1 [Bidens hawaiensis]|uniref:receptor-like protein kinase HERK 1 n=1 Tax=Bidens hawaiensis TaxID=980011 RepID=UPI00404A36A8